MEPHSYRMVISTKLDYVTTAARAEQRLVDWLTEKRYNASALTDGRNDIAESVTLDLDSTTGRDGAYTRWRMRENPSPQAGTWQSTLTVRADHRDDDRQTWVQVEIEHRPTVAGAIPTRANTPRIARLLLDAIDAQDGLAQVTSAPRFIEAGDVDEVIEELCDEDRRLPIVVATVPYGRRTDVWVDDVVDRAFRFLPGLAIMYVLTPEAQPEFNKALEFHPVYGGGIRTYLPGIDLAWKPDAQRHPVMARTTVEANLNRRHGSTASKLAFLPQRLALRQPLPQPLDTLPVQRTRPRPQVEGSELHKLTAENSTLHAMLAEAEQTEASHADEISELRRDVQHLEVRTYQLSGEYDELYAELIKARHLTRTLQARLTDAGSADLAYAPAEEPADRPTTFEQLIQRIGELKSIRFTGNKKITHALDEHSASNWVDMAWDALLALDDFATASAAGTAGGDFRAWCSSPSADAHPFPAGKVKMRESDTVANNRTWRRERTFPVPAQVDAAEEVYMQAHLRIGGGNTVAPRLHFHDDGPGETGLLYVGYIGPHLTNTRTS
ncbi:hypothetical protein [Streptomyces cremeus]|uniref:Uncharacterized protein n=1 Tax=Streptomyces cremeus TaxID=66881 RepID=A0ABV5P5C5_STRCM